MRDSEQEYPLHQPGRGGQHHPFDDDTIADERADQGPFQEPLQPGQGPIHQRTMPANPRLPRGHLRKALIIGVIAGLVATLQGIIITLANASLYHTVSTTPQNKLSLSLAEAVVGLLCLNLFISLIIYFAAGFITGKVAVDIGRPEWRNYHSADPSRTGGSDRRACELLWSLARHAQAPLLLCRVGCVLRQLVLSQPSAQPI